MAGNQIYVMSNAKLHVKNCSFTGAVCGVRMSALSTVVEIVGCLFQRCGIEIAVLSEDIRGDDHVSISSAAQLVDFKCIGNVFGFNEGYPIAMRNTDGLIDFLDGFVNRSMVKYNSLKRYNATTKCIKHRTKEVSANEVYISESLEVLSDDD
eukprot:108639_1